jgi:hypothetical protein
MLAVVFGGFNVIWRAAALEQKLLIKTLKIWVHGNS